MRSEYYAMSLTALAGYFIDTIPGQFQKLQGGEGIIVAFGVNCFQGFILHIRVDVFICICFCQSVVFQRNPDLMS